MCAPDPQEAAKAASAPVTVSTPLARRSPPPTFSPSPCSFLWADCAEEAVEEVSVMLVSWPDAAGGAPSDPSLTRPSGASGCAGRVLLGE